MAVHCGRLPLGQAPKLMKRKPRQSGMRGTFPVPPLSPPGAGGGGEGGARRGGAEPLLPPLSLPTGLGEWPCPSARAAVGRLACERPVVASAAHPALEPGRAAGRQTGAPTRHVSTASGSSGPLHMLLAPSRAGARPFASWHQACPSGLDQTDIAPRGFGARGTIRNLISCTSIATGAALALALRVTILCTRPSLNELQRFTTCNCRWGQASACSGVPSFVPHVRYAILSSASFALPVPSGQWSLRALHAWFTHAPTCLARPYLTSIPTGLRLPASEQRTA